MDTVKQILGIQEDEVEDGKISQEAVIYLKPEQIAAKEGAHCGACIFFKRETSECLITAPAKCNAEHGVCGFYVGRQDDSTEVEGERLGLIPKKMAGYIEKAPTHCANCEYFGGKKYPGECAMVRGKVEGEGCCNHWEPK